MSKVAVLSAKIHLGGPVGGHVLLDVAGAADRVARVLEIHGEVEPIATTQYVDMLRDLARLDNGVGALVVEAAATAHHKCRLSLQGYDEADNKRLE